MMSSVVAQQTVDLGSSGPTTAQTLLAGGIAVVALILLIVVFLGLRRAGLENWQVAHRDAIAYARRTATRVPVYLYYDSPDQHREKIVDALERGDGEATGIIQSVKEETTKKVRTITTGPIRYGLQAVVYMLFGAMLFLSLGFWRDALNTPDGGGNISQFFTELVGAVDTFVAFTLSSPVFKLLYAQVLRTIITVLETVYSEYLLVGVTLLFVAGLLALVSRIDPERVGLDSRVDISRIALIKYIAGSSGLLWFASVVPYRFLNRVVESDTALLVGGVFTGIAILSIVGYGLLRFAYRFYTVVRTANGENAATALYLVVRWITSALGTLTLPFIGIYSVQLVLSGRLYKLIELFQNGSTLVQAVAAGAVGLLAAVLIYQVVDILRESRRALRRLLSKLAVKTRLVYESFSGLAFIALLVALVSTGEVDIVASLATATIFGLVIRSLLRILVRVALGAKERRRRTRANLPSRAYVELFWLNDALDRQYPAARINGDYTVMGPADDVDAFANELLAIMDGYWETGSVRMSQAEYHYNRARRFGFTPREEADAAVTNELRESIVASLERVPDGEMTESTLRQLTETYPESMYEDAMQQLEDEKKIRRAGNSVALIDERYYTRRDGVIDRLVKRLT